MCCSWAEVQDCDEGIIWSHALDGSAAVVSANWWEGERCEVEVGVVLFVGVIPMAWRGSTDPSLPPQRNVKADAECRVVRHGCGSACTSLADSG
jgi:hypothetical protein